MKPATPKRWKARLLALSLSILFALLLAEVGLRIIGFSRPYFYAYDENLGWTLRPETNGWFRKEGAAYIHINNAGMRDDRDYVIAKPNGTFRIAVLGDSFAEALQVPTAQTFWSIMQDRLSSCSALAGRRVEVLNFGVSSYGTAQELIMLRKRVWQYSPDLIILAFTPANDVRNNSRVLEHDELRPYFVLQNNELTEDDSFRQSPGFRQKQSFLNRTLYRFINYSRVLQLINGVRDDIVTRRQLAQSSNTPQPQAQETPSDTPIREPTRAQFAVSAQTSTSEAGIDAAAYGPPQDSSWSDAWLVTEAMIAEMNREVIQHGAQFLVVTVTSGAQVNPDLAARRALLANAHTTDLFYVEERIQSIGGREHFPVLTLGQPFAQYALEKKVALHGFGLGLNLGHWNAEGHRLAGQMISDDICKLLASTSANRSQP